MTETKMTLKRWSVAAAASLVLAAITGLVAQSVRAEDARAGWVFAVMSLPCWLGLAQAVLTPAEDGPDDHPEDTVEREWLSRASAAAFADVVGVLGVATFVTALTNVDSVPSVVFLALAMVDVAARYLLLRRRES